MATKAQLEYALKFAAEQNFNNGINEGLRQAEQNSRLEQLKVKSELIKALTQMISNQGQTVQAINSLVDNMGWK